MVELASLRREPDASSEQVTQVLGGEPLVVEEVRNGWRHVRTMYGYPGWIEARAVENDADPTQEARAYLGSPYVWGGMTRRGIDCSGLVHMAFRATGRLVPRDADQQEEAAELVPENELRPGDLVTYGGDYADHIAFWVGDGRILHSTRRPGARGVVEEEEPLELHARRRRLIRL